jgi:hypothetical protein
MTTQDTRPREAGQRKRTEVRQTGSVRVGSSALREGRPGPMETTTRDRGAVRVPPPRRAASGPFRADLRTRPASAPAAQPTLTKSRPTPARSASPLVTGAPTAPPRSAPSRPDSAPGVSRATARPSPTRAAARSEHKPGAAVPRMRFALLVLVLLGGGLVCLLVINTTLGATSFRISQLQSRNATLTSQQQALQQQIAAELSPALIARRAYALGMRVESNGNILDLRTHRFDKLSSQPGATVPLGALNNAAGGSGQ